MDLHKLLSASPLSAVTDASPLSTAMIIKFSVILVPILFLCNIHMWLFSFYSLCCIHIRLFGALSFLIHKYILYAFSTATCISFVAKLIHFTSVRVKSPSRTTCPACCNTDRPSILHTQCIYTFCMTLSKYWHFSVLH